MKNLLAILAVVLLGTSFMFAANNATSNTLTLSVVCPAIAVTNLASGMTGSPFSLTAGSPTLGVAQTSCGWNIAGFGLLTATNSIGITKDVVTGITQIPVAWLAYSRAKSSTTSDITAVAMAPIATLPTAESQGYVGTACNQQFDYTLQIDITVPAAAIAGTYANAYTLTVTD